MQEAGSTEDVPACFSFGIVFFLNVPVYYEPFNYAKENDEVDLYRTSYRLNSECKQAIHEAIADNYDGMYLGDDAVDQVVRQYGMNQIRKQRWQRNNGNRYVYDLPDQ